MTPTSTRSDSPPPTALPLALSAALALAIALLPAPPLSAQEVKIPDEVFVGQPPLTEADVPGALELFRAITTDPNPQTLMDIGKRHGFDEHRVAYVTTKFGTGLLIVTPGGMTKDQAAEQIGNPLAVPTDSELEVIRGALPQMMGIL
ncbi:MAG: hypothetical protein LBQ12_09210, partial [Deltaproteobacteria bacterium]|nr:hypothetical protein [Deltaproteobacteria bacterium]